MGPDSRAERLSATARAFRHPRSPLERANDRLLLWLVGLSAPLAIGLTVVGPGPRRVRRRPGAGVTAGIVNLVPEGLILLISVTAAVSAFKMAQTRRARAAAQRDRVAGVGRPRLHRQDRHADRADAARRVGWCRRTEPTRRRSRASWPPTRPARPSRNLTLEAIADAEPRGCRRAAASSARCRSPPGGAGARSISVTRRLVLGAPERFADARPAPGGAGARGGERRPARAGARPNAIARCPPTSPSRSSRDDVQPLGLVVLAERLRANAAETVAFFAAQDVELKVLSGDAPATVGAIARDAGVPGSAPALDGEALPVGSGGAARGRPRRARRRTDLTRGQARGRGRAHRRGGATSR